MIKNLLKLLSCCMAIVLSLFLFSGCTSKTYRFIGIVDEATNNIILYENLDEETKSSISNILGEDAKIVLSANDKFTYEYVVRTASMEITYKQFGNYKLNEKEKTIDFYYLNADGTNTITLNQQYENGKIIYYTNGQYLVFE